MPMLVPGTIGVVVAVGGYLAYKKGYFAGPIAKIKGMLGMGPSSPPTQGPPAP